MSMRSTVVPVLLLVAALLAACEGDRQIVIGPPLDTANLVSLTLLPETVSLNPAETRQLVAVVTGSANQAANWSSADPAVASVNSSGLVTAHTIGSTVITAVSQVDARARDATTVDVRNPPDLPVPSITIQTISQTGTQNAVNIGNVQGAINVIANIEVPAGVPVNRVEFLVDTMVVGDCTRSLGTTTSSEVTTQQSLPLLCGINTARYDTITGAAAWANGTHRISARAIMSTGSVGASSGVDVNLNNPNFLLAHIAAPRGPAPGVAAPRSLLPAIPWRAGPITVTVLPVLFQRTVADSLSQVTVTLVTSGTGVSGVAGCAPTGVSSADFGGALHDPTIAAQEGGAGKPGSNGGATPNCPIATAVQSDADASNGLSVVFPDTLPMSSGGVAGIEEQLTFMIESRTNAGLPGPVCINPGATNPLTHGPNGANCGTGVGTASAANRVPGLVPWLHDNLAPRITSLNIKRAGVDPFFNTQTFSSGVGAAANDTTIGVRTVDYGAGGQLVNGNTSFLAGTALGSMTALSNTNTLDESDSRYFFQASVQDGVGNQRIATATENRFVIASADGTVPAGTTLQVQDFGVDFTLPVVTVAASTPADNSLSGNSAAPGGYTLTPADPGTGPSGFSATPFRVRAELINASGTVCYDLEAGSQINCSAGGGLFATDGVFDLATGANGYWRITWTVADRAGNTTAPDSRVHLIDAVFPVVGGFSIPAAIGGGQSVTLGALVSDNVELKDYITYLGFAENGLSFVFEEPKVEAAAYGPEPLLHQTTASATYPNFLRSIESSANGLPTGISARATAFNVLLRDQLDNTTGQATGILSSVAAGIGGPGTESSWGGAGRPFSTAVNPSPSFQSTIGATSICVDTDGDGCTAPTSKLLTATATGPALTFANPFARLSFYYRHPLTGRLHFIGNAGATSVDNTSTNVRTWLYQGVTFTLPAGFPAGTVFHVVAIGVDAAGRGLASAFAALTQVPD